MRLLFDANVSPELVQLLGDLYPGSTHVFSCGDIRTDDKRIWEHARTHGFVVVSKDADFRGLSFLLGAPPKVIWLRVGNASTSAIERLLRDRFSDAIDFEVSQDAALLIVSC